MSTQHPDNACVPPWSKGEVIQGDDEVHEVYLAYSNLGCHEVMWDSEGKDVDTHVIRKLLAGYGDYFKENIVGRDVFLTYRIPNPRVEVAERKVVAETLENIPVCCDVASAFYRKEVTPIFEVILPFTTDGKELMWLSNYYRKAIVDVEDIELGESVKVKDWVGPFRPSKIEVIPLVEDMESLLAIDKIVEPYLDFVRPRHIRVFIARSDPALNYGLICAMVLSKLALSKLRALEKKKAVSIYPIIGVGTMPFRGHLSPDNIRGFLNEHKGVHTVTIQSALKYDHPPEEVKSVVKTLNEELPHGEPALIDPKEEEILVKVLSKLKSRYQRTVEGLAPLINSVASHIPQRRARKLHIGLFGYSRNVADVLLPRAIPFAGALYSLGIPPEFIGLQGLSDLGEEEWDLLKEYYANMKRDLDAVAGYLSWQNVNALMDTHKLVARRANTEEGMLRSALSELLLDLEFAKENLGVKLGPRNMTHRRYESILGDFLSSYQEGDSKRTQSCLIEAAKIRRCLG